MKALKLLSWNVNGIRAVKGRGLLEWLSRESPDMLCLQETKARPEQLDADLLKPEGYHTYWNYPERKGYSGVVLYTKEEPRHISYNLGDTSLYIEGRVIVAEYPEFTLMNVYFPNGKKNQDRLDFKMAFYDVFLNYADKLRASNKKIIICGDVNTAHEEIDLARPKENSKVSGFLPIERQWIDELVSHGYVDTFRQLNQETGQYSWWDMKSGARARNVGWRIDYFFVSEDLLPSLSGAFIMPEVMGSDHCPVGISLKVS